VLACTLTVLVACLVLAEQVQVDTSYKRAFKESDPVRIEDARINASLAGTNTLVMLVEGEQEGSLEEPNVMRAIAAVERRLEAEPGVGKALSYVDFLRKMHRAMNADRPDAGDLPTTRELTAQYLFLYSMSGGGGSLDPFLDPAHRIAKVRLLTREDSTRYGDGLISLAQEAVAQTFPPGYRVRFTGSLASTSAGTEVMVSGKLRNILQIALIIVAISSLLLRSLVGGLLVAVPLALTVAINFGVMGLVGLPLDTNTATIASIAVGIGADYAIYLLFRVREELAGGLRLDEALRCSLMTSGKAVLFVSSAIAAGYATLCFSGFSHYVRLGALVALAMLVSSASTLILIPALVTRFRPAFLWAGLGSPAELAPAEHEPMAAA
jgi:predicted RND superfamily exporter protein